MVNFEEFFDENVELVSRLETATADGDIAVVKEILSQHQALVFMPSSGIDGNPSLLHIAARNGRTALCEFLVERGISVDSASENYGFHVPLAEAASKGQVDTINWLLSEGASVDGSIRSVSTPLMSAAIFGHEAAMRTLLQHGAEINRIHGKWPKTAADLAHEYGHQSLSQRLVECGGVRLQIGPTDWSMSFGGSIIAYIEEAVGQVLNVAYGPAVDDTAVRLRIARVQNKDTFKLLFSNGIFNRGQLIELGIVLPSDWPVHNTALNSNSRYSFPMQLLLNFGQQITQGKRLAAGDLITHESTVASGLIWPETVAALLVVDHDWPAQNIPEDDEHLFSEDEVIIFSLMPIAHTKAGIPKGAKKEKLLAGLQKASWKRACLAPV